MKAISHPCPWTWFFFVNVSLVSINPNVNTLYHLLLNDPYDRHSNFFAILLCKKVFNCFQIRVIFLLSEDILKLILTYNSDKVDISLHNHYFLVSLLKNSTFEQSIGICVKNNQNWY